MNSRYHELCERDQTYPTDMERKSMFWILASNEELYRKIQYIYDFEDKCILPECLSSPDFDFSSSAKCLIHLAFNLYNGFNDGKNDVYTVFYNLDAINFNIAITAIKIRFGKE